MGGSPKSGDVSGFLSAHPGELGRARVLPMGAGEDGKVCVSRPVAPQPGGEPRACSFPPAALPPPQSAVEIKSGGARARGRERR